jgi:hypothetical protein
MAVSWYTEIYRRLDDDPFFANYLRQKRHEWTYEDLKALTRFLSCRRRTRGAVECPAVVEATVNAVPESFSDGRVVQCLVSSHNTGSRSESFRRGVGKSFQRGLATPRATGCTRWAPP